MIPASAPSEIERVVMRRVRMIRFLRLLFSAQTLVALALAVVLWGIGREVWVAKVFENMPHSGDPFAVGRFYLSAFEKTRVVVQALMLGALGALIYLARETTRGFART